MPAAVLAGGGSRRMGVPKASLPYGRTTLLAHQTERLSRIFEEVLVVAKEAPGFDAGPARLVLDRTADQAPIHGLARALEEASDRLFVLAVDLPLLSEEVIRAIARGEPRIGGAGRNPPRRRASPASGRCLAQERSPRRARADRPG